MAHFNYTARSKTGEKASGVIQAPSKVAAMKEVERMGLFPVTIEQAEVHGADAGSTGARAQTFSAPTSGLSEHLPAESSHTNVESLQRTRDWFIAAQTRSGQQRLYDKEHFVASLRAGILAGLFNSGTMVDVHAKAKDGKWNKTSAPLAQFAKGHFQLRVLYEPVWSYAKAGLKWGAVVGVGLKLFHTLILFCPTNPMLAIILFVAFGSILLTPRLTGPLFGVACLLFYSAKTDFLDTSVSTLLVGAALGCFPGQAVGGIIGRRRRKALPLAKDATPESDNILLKAVVFPLLGAAAVWAFYFLVATPWLANYDYYYHRMNPWVVTQYGKW